MTYKLTILGCGPSGGVPRVGPNWGACDKNNPKNRRLRCSVLIERLSEHGATKILIDTSPDLREQLLSARVKHLDGVLFTHDHADHTHGIDDLRPICFAMKKRVNIYCDETTAVSLTQRFSYCFAKNIGAGYNPILRENIIEPRVPVKINGAGGEIEVLPIEQRHGDITSLGFRIGNLAYSPDISDLPDISRPQLHNLDVWIIDALRYTSHPSHFSVSQALAWTKKIGPKKAIFTHMATDLDYAKLKADLPKGIEPAYDGMEIEFA